MTERAQTRSSVALGALVFAAVAPLAYMAQRIYERARYGVVDPSLILKSTHIDYLWRIAIASWWAGGCAIVVVLVHQRRDARQRASAVRAVSSIAIAFAAIATLLAWTSP